MFRVHAARFRPELFSALTLLDPVIIPAPTEPGTTWADGWGTLNGLTALLDGAVTRRNGWESKYALCCPLGLVLIRNFCSRTEALQSFKKSPFFATWDPLSLELYVECQLWEDTDARVAKLKMSGIWVGGRTALVSCCLVLIALHRRAHYLLDIVGQLRRGIPCRYSTNGLL